MDKPKLLKLVNLGLGFSFTIVVVTGLIKFPGFLSTFGISLRSLPIIQISQLHDWSGLLMVVLASAHIWLNWGWVASNFLRKK